MAKKLCEFCNAYSPLEPSLVVGKGNPDANLMLIGEAPGAQEEILKAPFVGRSGKVIQKLLEGVGIDFDKEIYICNVIKCRPPNNRRPTKIEIAESLPWLMEQIRLVDPSLIILAGSTAVNSVLDLKTAISTIRGQWQLWEGRLVMPIFHPSYLLRNPSNEEGKPISLTRSDLMKVRDKLYMSQLVSEDNVSETSSRGKL